MRGAHRRVYSILNFTLNKELATLTILTLDLVVNPEFLHYYQVCVTFKPPPFCWLHLFRGTGHEKRRREQLKQSLAFGCTLEVFHVYSYQDQFIQPGWAECFLYIYLRFVLCVFICAFWFVCISLCFLCFMSSWVISLTVFGTSITNLNEPPRALVALQCGLGDSSIPFGPL